MGGYGSPALTLLLLIWHSGGGAAFTLTSNSSGNQLTGRNISLDISYNTQAETLVTWYKDGITLAWLTQGRPSVASDYQRNVLIIGNGSLLILNSTKKDNGNYTVTVAPMNQAAQRMEFQVKVYDPVENVTVTQSPQLVDERTPEVSLTCSAVGDVESASWTRNGLTLGYNDSYILLDGNRTLQIKYPNRTFTGNYTCNASNPVSWDQGSWELNVSYSDSPNAAALSGGAIAGIVIGSVLGAILLIILLIILIFCIRKRKNGKEKKPGGPQHKDVIRTVSGNTVSKDDPAYFTVNNIMYRNSSISMGSYIMNSGDNMSEYSRYLTNPPSTPPKIKHATQV